MQASCARDDVVPNCSAALPIRGSTLQIPLLGRTKSRQSKAATGPSLLPTTWRFIWRWLAVCSCTAALLYVFQPLCALALLLGRTGDRWLQVTLGPIMEQCTRHSSGMSVRRLVEASLLVLSVVVTFAQVAVTALTRWVVEPLSALLLLDSLLLTGSGLLYQVWTRLRKHSRSQQARHKAARIHSEVPDQPKGRCDADDALAPGLWGRRREQWLALPEESWPRVLVQLPMYNEREVYPRAIASACQLAWPRSRLVVQVLDDSTEEDISAGMRQAVEEWKKRGVDVRYRQRVDRKGYKAGNLREGLLEDYAKACKYVAVLDADFEPRADWLLQAVPFLEEDKRLALVQTRWTFSNEDENLLTQLQSVELTWHFWAEQLVSSLALRCFGFNGTAGVWRSEAILDAGNWRDDTTVEDMDMAVCAAMRGWRMLMVPEVRCLSEVPSSYSAYRKQQHRWTSGPASLLRQRFWSIACTPGEALGWGAKIYLIGVYMILRRSIRHLVGMLLWVLLSFWLLMPTLCALINHVGSSGSISPAACSPPYIQLGSAFINAAPFPWMALAFALAYPLCLLCFSPKKVHLYPAYLLFMNGMLPSRVYAVLAGLFDLTSSRTWDVTQKLGKKKNASCCEASSREEGQVLAGLETQLVVSVERANADALGVAKLVKRQEASVDSSCKGEKSSNACSKVCYSNTPGAVSKRPAQAGFQQEIVMGWCVLVVASTALSWVAAYSWLNHGLSSVPIAAALAPAGIITWMVLQGCWNLWVGSCW